MPEAKVVWDAPKAFIVRLRWQPAGEAAEREMFQVLRVEQDLIREIADYRVLGAATKTAKRFAAS